MSIFRAYDIRGIYGKDLTDEVAFKIGKALGTFLEGREKVCVGYDTRPSSPTLFKNLISGLLSTGCKVVSIGMVPNPVAYFFAWKKKIFGCYVTASHNPVEWNGFKIFKPNGTSFTEKEIKKLERIYNSGKFIVGKGNMEKEKNAIREYMEFLLNKLNRLEGKIIVDFLGGAGVCVAKIFKKIGLKTVLLHNKPDASLYGFHRLEPWGDLLNLVKKAVKKEKADLGVAFDADADRSVFIDSKGNFVDPSKISAIFIHELLKSKRGKVVLTYDCAVELEEFVRKLRSIVIWSRIGHSFIEEKLVKEKAIFGGEQSSHFFFNIFYPFSDGILSTLYLIKILNKNKKSLEEFVKQFKFNPIAKLYINAKTDEAKVRVIEEIRRKYRNSIDVGDGFKVFLNKGEWVLIRASQTLPEINLCIQAKNRRRLKGLVEKYSRIIKKKIRELNG